MLDARARLLTLRAYLLEHTDERHSVTAREIIAYLELAPIDGLEVGAGELDKLWVRGGFRKASWRQTTP